MIIFLIKISKNNQFYNYNKTIMTECRALPACHSTSCFHGRRQTFFKGRAKKNAQNIIFSFKIVKKIYYFGQPRGARASFCPPLRTPTLVSSIFFIVSQYFCDFSISKDWAGLKLRVLGLGWAIWAMMEVVSTFSIKATTLNTRQSGHIWRRGILKPLLRLLWCYPY